VKLLRETDHFSQEIQKKTKVGDF